jgi:hypothetical protein
MEKRETHRAFWIACAGLISILLVRLGLVLLGLHGPGLAGRSVLITRLVAGAFLLSDVAVSASLITLLVTRDRSAPPWAERRLPLRGRWLWHLLLGLTILSYVSLAPTFLFFYIQLRR